MDIDTRIKTPNQEKNMRDIADMREIHAQEAAIDARIIEGVEPFIEMGATVFRLRSRKYTKTAKDAKKPIEKWGELPPRSLEEIQATGRKPLENFGIALGARAKTPWGYLHCMDCDLRDPAKKAEMEAALNFALPKGARVFVVRSGSGKGYHLYFFAPEPLPGQEIGSGDGWEVVLKGTGQYVVAPGSLHPDTGKPYRWIKGKRLETDMLDLVAPPVVNLTPFKRAEPEPIETEDTLIAELLGNTSTFAPAKLQELLDEIPIEATDRDSWLKAQMAVHYESGGADWGFDMVDSWSAGDTRLTDQGKPMYPGTRALRRQWNGFKITARPITGGTLVSLARDGGWCPWTDDDFEDLPEPFEDLLGEDEPTLNDRYAMVRVGKDVQIVDRQADGLSLISVRAFRDLHAFQARGDKWIKSEKRTTFEGELTFDPSGRVHKDKLNLWKGFAIEPDETGNCDLIVNHIRDVWASGDTAHFDYIVSWLADIVQNPANKPRVALVLKGGKGAGKDSLVDLMRRIVGSRHYALANSPDVLTSNFNGLYDTALLIHAEEASWGGDKKAKGILQSLITNDWIRIERKGVDAVQIPSFHRVIFSTNEDWAVPATADERRYAVFNVSDHRIGDHDYFDALHRQIRGDGAAAFMAFLMAWKTPDGIRIGKPPQKRGLLDQKLAGLRNVEAWWFEKLCAGFTGCDEFGDESEWRSGPLEVIKTDLHSDYCNWMNRQRHHGDTKVATKFGEALLAMCPMMETRRRRGGSAEGSGRQRAYSIPQLDECRRAFAGYMKSDEAHFNWSEDNG